MEPTPVSPPVKRPAGAPPIRNLEFKVGLLLVLTVALGIAFVVFSLYSRGAFEATQDLVLTAPDAENVSIGMPLTYSGFPVGKVKRIHLQDDGTVRIVIAVPRKDTRWLRDSSVFTLEKGLIGGARIKAHTAELADPPLPEDAVRPLIVGDASQDIPVVINQVKDILANVQAMTAGDSAINQTLGNVQTVTARMTGEYGVLEGVLGGPDKAREVVSALQKANTLLGNLDGVSLKVDTLLARTDQRVFGDAGVMDQVQGSLTEVRGILTDVRTSLKQADAIIANAQRASADVAAITGNVREATTDMALLRVEIDDSVRKVNHLINEINRKWPFSRDVEIRTP